jgi:hypothetical protein
MANHFFKTSLQFQFGLDGLHVSRARIHQARCAPTQSIFSHQDDIACITDTSLVVAALGLDIVLARQLDSRSFGPIGSSTVVCSTPEYRTKATSQNCRENRPPGIIGKRTRMGVQDRDRSMSGRPMAEGLFDRPRAGLSPGDQLATRRTAFISGIRATGVVRP